MTHALLLITGNGWLGSRLAQILNRKDGDGTLRIGALPKYDFTNKYECEVFCKDFKGATLIHTAGVIHPRRAQEFYTINVDATRNLLDAAIKAGIKRFIAISSNSVCGCNPHNFHRFEEDAPYHPYQHYGRSKMAMEQMLMEASGEIETVILRACWFYGPNQPERQTTFFKMIAQGKFPIVGDGNNFRSMTYIDNLCDAILLAVESGRAAGRTFWIADRYPYTMNKIVDTIERLMETEFIIPCAHNRLHLPNLASKVAFGLDTALQALGRYNQKIHVLSEMDKTIACSMLNAQISMGYAPAIELEEGMRRSLRWCRERKLI